MPNAKKQIRDKKFEEICDKLADHHGSPSWRILPKCRLAASTGNLAREAFSDLPFLSEVTGISIEFLEGVKNIWILIRSEQFIHPERFRDYCLHVKNLWKKDPINHGKKKTIYNMTTLTSEKKRPNKEKITPCCIIII